MVTPNWKKRAAKAALILLAVGIFIVATQVNVPANYPHPGEGYADPATAVHITPNGDVINPTGNYSNINIQRDGTIYTLTGNITYWLIIEKSNIVLDGKGFSFNGSHGLSLSDVSNVTVRNLEIQTHYLRLYLDYTKNSVIQNVSSSYRVTVSHSDNNVISNCTGVIELNNSSGNTIKNCVATGEIILSQSHDNSIIYNTISVKGPSLGLWHSSNNLIFGNTFETFWSWISMSGDSTNNKIVANNVWAGQIYQVDKLVGTNYIYHNNFYKFNWNQSADTNSANIWSNEGRGNYWGYSGTDMNNDGVGDIPYIIDRTNKDDYPLMAPVDIVSEPLP